MVHGGGHHHTSGGGGGSTYWGDSSKSYQRTNVVTQGNNNNNNNNNEECNDCCQKCCLSMCACCLVGEAAARVRNRSSHSFRCGPCPFISLSILFLISLVVTSHVNLTWTMNAGETRQVKTKRALNGEVDITSNIPESTNIYTFDGACPPLTGPIVALGNTEDIVLAEGDYQYDYFFLNKGSVVDVTLTQHFGATNVMLLRGLSAVEEESNKNTDDDSFSFETLLKRFAGEGQEAHLKYTAKHSDTYVILYDNASNSQGRATVTYTIDMTTYDLFGKAPLDNCAASVECKLNVHKDCVLVQATTEVTIEVTADKRWGMILFFSSLPLIFGYFWLSRQQRLRNAEVYEGYACTPVVEAEVIPVATPIPSAPPGDKL